LFGTLDQDDKDDMEQKINNLVDTSFQNTDLNMIIDQRKRRKRAASQRFNI